MATVKIKYLLKKDCLLYYQRGIPLDLRPHYSGRNLIRINLKTTDIGRAAKLCAQYASSDDALWRTLRSPEGESLTTAETRAAGRALLEARGGHMGIINWKNPVERRLSKNVPKERGILLSEVLDRYLAEHKRGQDLRFARDAQRAVGIVVQMVGDLSLRDYTRDHARVVRDALIPGHSTATVRRQLDSICAVFNLGRREFDINCMNPFEKLAIQKEGLDAKKRLPFSTEERETISLACRKADDDIRWIVAIQLATGARLGEIVGLRREDIILDHEIPHIWIRPHEALGRSLKTPGSERKVPLIGIGLWAAERAMAAAELPAGLMCTTSFCVYTSDWVFPRYCSDGNIRATHASNTINKWVAQTLGIPKTTHSARHSMKDLLRNSGCSEELSKTLLGHGTRSISDQYGAGFSLQRLRDALSCIAPPPARPDSSEQ